MIGLFRFFLTPNHDLNIWLHIKCMVMAVKKKPPDKAVKKYEASLKQYKSVKVPLKSIIKNDQVLQTIESTVIRMNKIIIHSYQFLKLYCISQY